MTRAVLVRAVGLWCVILGLAILNGMVREAALIPLLGRFAGYLISGLLLSAAVFVVALVAVPGYGVRTSRDWLSIGLLWLVLTLAFEFGLGRLIQDKPWAELLAAYRFRDGNLWPLVLLVTGLSPWLAARVRGAV